MLAWAKRRALALTIATLMFAVMAVVMAEFLTRGDLFDVFETGSDAAKGMLWTWRVGGLVTWPVFMGLLLRPYVDSDDGRQRAVLARTLVVAAIYGGGGLWAISGLWQAFLSADENIVMALSPFMALTTVFLPYAYTWGFVAIYGFARDGLAGRRTHGWISRSLLASVLGVYCIGALVYAALGIVTIPVASVVSLLPEEVSLHLAFGIWGIAISTGNFASQWYSFFRVDEWFDAAESRVEEQDYGRPPVVAAPDGNVYLADGRIVTPDGRVYVPQGSSGSYGGGAPSSSSQSAPQTRQDPHPPAPPQDSASDPYGYSSKH